MEEKNVVQFKKKEFEIREYIKSILEKTTTRKRIAIASPRSIPKSVTGK